jgi:signal transduction histidine kinase
LDNVARQYASTCEVAGIDIKQVAEPTPVLADADLILQVMVNLMDNAVRHTPPGGTITLGCALSGVGARFWIEDTGPGIPEQWRSRVFDRFFRVDEGRTRRDGGVGLGLSICHAIIAAHRGSISVENVTPTGLRVNIRLP